MGGGRPQRYSRVEIHGAWEREGLGPRGTGCFVTHLRVWFTPLLPCSTGTLAPGIWAPPRPSTLDASFPTGPSTCLVSLLLTPSTLFLLDEDAAGSPAEPSPPAASGEASEKVPPSGPGPAVRVREQQPLSSLSSVLLYRSAPEDLRLLFYDEVCVCVSPVRGREGRW